MYIHTSMIYLKLRAAYMYTHTFGHIFNTAIYFQSYKSDNGKRGVKPRLSRQSRSVIIFVPAVND